MQSTDKLIPRNDILSSQIIKQPFDTEQYTILHVMTGKILHLITHSPHGFLVIIMQTL
jgi:hypothetical protein